jgi:hypothetical protein
MMKAILIIIPLVIILSCVSKPGSQPDAVIQDIETSVEVELPAPVPAAVVVEEVSFDPSSITKEEYNTTKADMERLITEINRVIRAKDFNGWISYLADDFIAAINSPDYLAQLSESSRQLKSQNIVLKTARDYFTYVVVASRENIRVDANVDDIEFVSYNRVKAFTINARKQRLRLFEFVRIEDTWKIVFSGQII